LNNDQAEQKTKEGFGGLYITLIGIAVALIAIFYFIEWNESHDLSREKISEIFTWLGLIFALILSVFAILMPIFVYLIRRDVAAIRSSIEGVEGRISSNNCKLNRNWKKLYIGLLSFIIIIFAIFFLYKIATEGTGQIRQQPHQPMPLGESYRGAVTPDR